MYIVLFIFVKTQTLSMLLVSTATKLLDMFTIFFSGNEWLSKTFSVFII